MDELISFFSSFDFQSLFDQWLGAITDPGQFLSEGFVPTHQQLIDGLKFYLELSAISLLFFGLISLFADRGSIEIKAKIVAIGLLGIIFFFVTAMAAHIPFWLLGGKAAFSGTLLAYIYAAVPYGPLVSIGQWIQVSGMPQPLRPYALNPATSQKAGQIAVQDPRTDKIAFFTGSLIVLAVFAWAIYQAVRWLSFVHDLGGWRLAVALVLYVVILIPVGRISQSMTSLIFGTPEAAHAADVGDDS